MDVVVHWLRKRYVIELKIWHGERHEAGGVRQAEDYLDRFGLDVGFLLSFDLCRPREPGVSRIDLPSGRVLVEGRV